jgi:eukaryotic-like serine/threonine-protein kinase
MAERALLHNGDSLFRCALPGPRDSLPPHSQRPFSDADVTFSDSSVGAPIGTPPSRPSAGSSGSSPSSGRIYVEPGSELGSRYHVETLLGEGGMGSVYKAYDRELDRMVAIKVIRPGLVAEPSAVQRFKQELLLGSKVSHKHILRIHDLGEVEGLKFISMAFVDGEDLHSILRREGRLPIDRAVAIGRQIAEALAAAHAEGVIHRDLKPHNILIDRSGTAFVSDFGLAKSLASAADMTRSGELLGTPRYMAPEQVSGGQVDHRVDLYAFGLILYEMVTGTVPFHGDSAIAELLLRVQAKPPDPRTVNADTPAPLAEVILRCLETNPNLRYQTAEDILAGLDFGLDAPSSSRRGYRRSQSIPLPLQPTPAPASGRSRQRIAAAAAATLAVAGIVGWLAVGRRSAPAAPSTATTQATAAAPQRTRFLAVLPFRVLGDPQQLRYVGDGVVEALSSRLFQLSDVTVVSSHDVEQARGAASIADAARTLGANLIVEGTVQGAGDSLRLVINLHDMASGKRTWSRQFTGTRETLFSLQDDIYDGLVGALGASMRPEAMAHTADRPTDDIEAYDLYLKGRDALRSAQDQPQLEVAIDFFRQAVRKDTRFALAHTGLADASLMMYAEKKDSLWMERARASAERAREIDDKLPQVHFALGSVYSESGRNTEAVVVLRKALELAPNSDEAYRRLGTAYQALGRKNEAIDALKKAVDVNPYFWVNHNSLGETHLQFGDHDMALEEFKRVIELEPNNFVGYNNIASAYFTQGKWEECVPAYEQAIKLHPHWLTYTNLGTAYFYLKRYDDAVKVFERAAALNPNDAITVGNFADGLRWAGQRDRSIATYSTALTLAFKELQVNPKDTTTLAMVALYYSKSGNDARARDFIQRARAIDAKNAALLYYEAIVHALAHRDAAAIASLDKALSGGYSAREAAEDPELQELAKTEAFSRLMQRFSSGT